MKVKMTRFIRIGLGIIIMLSSLELFAQQDPMFSNYMFNLATVNPASVGHSDLGSVMSVNRFQWVGIEGAPETHTLNAEYPLKSINCGAGLTYVLDKVGPERSNNFYLDYAYHLKLTENLKLGLGLNAGFRVFSASLRDDIGQSGDDPQFSSNIKGKFTPNFGVGAFLYDRLFYVGISSPKILNHKYVHSTTSGGEKRHFYLVSGYVYYINKSVIFKPSVYFKFVEGAPLSCDINTNFLINNRIWFGTMFRWGDAIGFLTQVQLDKKWRLGYTYDFSFSKMRTVSKGSHEIMLTFEFETKESKDKTHWYF